MISGIKIPKHGDMFFFVFREREGDREFSPRSSFLRKKNVDGRRRCHRRTSIRSDTGTDLNTM